VATVNNYPGSYFGVVIVIMLLIKIRLMLFICTKKRFSIISNDNTRPNYFPIFSYFKLINFDYLTKNEEQSWNY
jgi:hypothetical protein